MNAPPLLRSRLLRSRLIAAGLSRSTASIVTGPGGPAEPDGPASIKLGHPGRPAPVPTMLACASDDSASVTGPGGADPIANRYAEIQRAFEVVARHGSGHELGAILHFDTPTTGDVPPTPLTKAGLHRLEQGLQLPPDAAGASLLGPSLTAARRLADAYPDHLATLVVLSDFALFDPNLADIWAELVSFPGDVHLIGLGRRLPDEARRPGVYTTTIHYDDPPGAVAHAVFESLTQHRPGRRLGAPGGG